MRAVVDPTSTLIYPITRRSTGVKARNNCELQTIYFPYLFLCLVNFIVCKWFGHFVQYLSGLQLGSTVVDGPPARSCEQLVNFTLAVQSAPL